MAAKNRSIQQILAEARPKTTTVRVCLRGDLLGQHQALERELAEARRLDLTENRLAQAPAVALRVQEVEAELDAAADEFAFAAIGQKAWTDLLVKHKPNEEQKAEGYEFDPATFPQAAVAASAVEPKMSQADVDDLFAALNFGQWQQLWAACLAVNVEGSSVPFSAAASAVLRGYETKSEPHGTTESPDPSS
jgi:hypothetical protein